jgi:Flp pilus assembly protein TadD
MRNFVRALIVVAALGVTGTAQAAADEFSGYAEIKRGDFVAAEKMLIAQRRIFPADADLAINLAAVYMHQGRFSEARALYNQVMARPNDLLDMEADRNIWSHDAATAGLARINHMQVTSR